MFAPSVKLSSSQFIKQPSFSLSQQTYTKSQLLILPFSWTGETIPLLYENIYKYLCVCVCVHKLRSQLLL